MQYNHNDRATGGIVIVALVSSESGVISCQCWSCKLVQPRAPHRVRSQLTSECTTCHRVIGCASGHLQSAPSLACWVKCHVPSHVTCQILRRHVTCHSNSAQGGYRGTPKKRTAAVHRDSHVLTLARPTADHQDHLYRPLMGRVSGPAITCRPLQGCVSGAPIMLSPLQDRVTSQRSAVDHC
jgi:hypothetical protein